MKKDTTVESYGATTGQTPPAAENLGKVEVSPEAIATITAQAIESSYGVVGLASRRLHNGLAVPLRPDRYREGIQIRFDGDQILLDLYVILDFDVRISEVAHTLMERVKFEVENHLGRTVAEVNVNVQGLRLPEGEKPSRAARRETSKES